MTKSLAEAAKAILTGEKLDETVGSEPMKTFKTANGAEVVDHGAAITHPLDGQQKHTDGDLKQDDSIPGATKGGEDKPVKTPGSRSPDDSKADGDSKGTGSIDGSKTSADSSIKGSGSKQDPMGMSTPGSNPPKSVKEEKVCVDTDPDKDNDKDKDSGKDKDDKSDSDKKKAAAMKEHVDALTSDEGLSEEFKAKAKTIFEAAVAERTAAIREEVEAEYATKLDEAVKAVKDGLENKLDDYLSYMVTEWVKKNEVAVDSGLRAEIMEDFVAGIKKVCEENYIEFPEEKANVVEELSASVEDLQKKVSDLLEQNVALTKQVNQASREKVVNEACEGLTAIQAGKIRKLAEGVTAETDEEYTKQIMTLRESYVSTSKTKTPTDTQTLVEDKATLENTNETVEVSPEMAKILGVLGRQPTFNKNS